MNIHGDCLEVMRGMEPTKEKMLDFIEKLSMGFSFARGWDAKQEIIYQAIRRLIEHGPGVSGEKVKNMASKIRNGVLDGRDDAWVENWLDVLLHEAGSKPKMSQGQGEPSDGD